MQAVVCFRHLLLRLLASLALAPALAAAPAALPPLRGSVSGELQVGLPDLTAIPWRAEVSPRPDGGSEFRLSAAPPDAKFEARLTLDASGTTGIWAIDEARVQVDAWASRLIGSVSDSTAEVTAGGELTLTGQGEWHEGAARGPLTLSWTSPAITLSAPAVAAEGVRFEFTLASGWFEGRWQGEGEVKIAHVTVAGLELRELRAELAWHSDQRLRVETLTAQAFGGTVELASFTWKPGQAELTVAAEFNQIDLEVLAGLLPELVRDAHGEVSGQARLRWREDLGVQPLGGELRETAGTDVRLRLAPQPGFLTRNVPRRIQILPDLLGRVAREWLAPENPVYATLEQIELGREPLVVQEFSLEFFPPDDPLGRTARIRVLGRPQADPQVEQVSLTINLSGPLADLLRLGADDRVQIRTQGGVEAAPTSGDE